jgi:nucleoside-diphosphate kinase
LERSLVLIKPDGIQRNLCGEIIKRLEQRGLKIVGCKFILVSDELARKHYEVHRGKPFFEGLVKYISSSPLLAMVWEGPSAVAAIRQTMGDKNPLEAAPGTIRHDLAILTSRNLTHGSDSPENAKIEISNWFSESELYSWERNHENWFTGKN